MLAAVWVKSTTKPTLSMLPRAPPIVFLNTSNMVNLGNFELSKACTWGCLLTKRFTSLWTPAHIQLFVILSFYLVDVDFLACSQRLWTVAWTGWHGHIQRMASERIWPWVPLASRVRSVFEPQLPNVIVWVLTSILSQYDGRISWHLCRPSSCSLLACSELIDHNSELTVQGVLANVLNKNMLKNWEK
jgi:hypothetical protein